MKSIIATILIFALILLALHFRLFEIMSSSYAYVISGLLVLVVLGFALKVFGSPFKNKDNRDEKM